MKMFIVLTLVLTLHATANVYSQNTKITLNFEEAKLGDVLSQIEKETEFVFFYRHGAIDNNTKVNIHAKDKNIYDVLNEMFRGTGIDYSVKDRLIILGQKEMNNVTVLQGITIAGTITDATGESMPGVNVVLKGTQIGIVTNTNGKYSITVPNKNAVLVFSFIGYATQEIVVGDKNVIDVLLAEDTQNIEEVVVIGYGTQQKTHLTGSVASLKGDKIIDVSTSNIATALQGRIAGVDIQNVTSEVGVAPEILIRGTGSLNNSTAPLVVVDGTPFEGGLNMLNPNDIASFEILKDASAAAIYGSRAAGGVILVTTKMSTTEKPTFNVRFYTGIKNPYKLYDVLTNSDYADAITMHNERLNAWNLKVLNNGWDNREIISMNTSEEILAKSRKWIEEQSGEITDWQRVVLNDNARITRINISATGGSKTSKYYISGGYVADENVLIKNKNNTFNALFKVDSELNRWLKIGANISGQYNNTSRPTVNFNGASIYPSFIPVKHNAWTAAFTKREIGTYARPVDFSTASHGNRFPLGQMTGYLPDDPDYGKDADYSVNPYNSGTFSPMQLEEKSRRQYYTYRGNGNLYLNVYFMDNLFFRTSNGFTYSYAPSELFYERNWNTTATANRADYTATQLIKWITENTMTYFNKFGKHDMSLMVGFSAERTAYTNVSLQGTEFPTDYVETINAASLKTAGSTWTNKNANSMVSVWGRLNYSYNDRYLVSLVMRADGSSRFGPDSRWGTFPSVSAGWRISEEDFMKNNVQWLNHLKLRASYGITGNNNIANYIANNTMALSSYPMGTGTGTVAAGLAPSGNYLGNRMIEWEQNNEYNLGLEIGVLNNRMTANIDAYLKNTKSMVYAMPIQNFSGFTNAWQNIGKIENKGLEISIDSRNIVRRDFWWNSSVVFSMNRNKLLELTGKPREDGESEYLLNPLYASGNQALVINKVGDPVIQHWGFKKAGIWERWSDIQDNVYPKWQSGTTEWIGGPRILDTGGGPDGKPDGIINEKDRVVLGNPYPDFIWGITNIFNYKGVELSFLIQGSQGGKIFNENIGNADIVQRHRAYDFVNRYLTPDHPGNYIPARAATSLWATDYAIEDASYACLRNVTLSYYLPQNILSKIGMQVVKIYLAGDNLFYVTAKSYRGINVESRVINTSNRFISGCKQAGAFPIITTYSFGIDITF